MEIWAESLSLVIKTDITNSWKFYDIHKIKLMSVDFDSSSVDRFISPTHTL